MKQTQHIDIAARDRTKAAFDSATRRLRGLGSVAVSLRGIMGGLAAVGFGVAARRSLEFGDRIQKLGVRLKTSTEFLSRMGFVAERSGFEFEQAAMGLQRMTRRLGQAADGSGEAVDALDELGVNARELANLPLETQFLTIAEALGRVENGSRRAALAQKIFDSEGVQLVQAMEDGAAGILELMQQSDELGRTLDQVSADSMAQAQDAMTNLSSVVQGLATDLTARLAPGLTTIGNILAATILPAIEAARGAFSGLFSLLGGVAESLFRVVEGDFAGAWDALKSGAIEAGQVVRDSFADAVDDSMKRFDNLGGSLDDTKKKADAAAQPFRNLLGAGGGRRRAEEDDDFLKAARGLLSAFGGDGSAGNAAIQTQAGNLNFANLITPTTRAQDRQTGLLEQIADTLEKIERQKAIDDVRAALAV